MNGMQLVLFTKIYSHTFYLIYYVITTRLYRATIAYICCNIARFKDTRYVVIVIFYIYLISSNLI